MATIVFTYRPIATNTNLEPIRAQLTRGGRALDHSGYTATVSIRDESTNDLVVAAADAVVDADGASYALPTEVVSLITRDSNWLVEWHFVSPSGAAVRTLVARLPVRVGL